MRVKKSLKKSIALVKDDVEERVRSVGIWIPVGLRSLKNLVTLGGGLSIIFFSVAFITYVYAVEQENMYRINIIDILLGFMVKK